MSEESNLHYLNIQNSVSCFLSLDSSRILNELIFFFLICVLHDILSESLLSWVYLYHFLSQIPLYSFSLWIITYLVGSLKEKTCVLSRSVFYHYFTNDITSLVRFNPLKTELNTICHLLALLGAHHILYISSIRVNSTKQHTESVLFLKSICW